MTSLLIRGAGVALLLLPGAAWACSPMMHDNLEPVRTVGERGAVQWQFGGYQHAGIGPARDLGNGFVVQWTMEGNACYGESSAIVQDCRSGEAVAVGGFFEAMDPAVSAQEEGLFDLIEARAAEGRPLSVAEITAEARARGVESVVPMRTDSRFRLGEFEFRLGEGCRGFYGG